MQNPKPPGADPHHGQLLVHGSSNDPGNSPIPRQLHLQHADLSVFNGIAGILNSTGQLHGHDSRSAPSTAKPIHLTSSSRVRPHHGAPHRLSMHGSTAPTAIPGSKRSNATWRIPLHREGAGRARSQARRRWQLHSVGHDIALTVDVTARASRISCVLLPIRRFPFSMATRGARRSCTSSRKATVQSTHVAQGHFLLDEAEFTSLHSAEADPRTESARPGKDSIELKSAEDEKIKSHVEGEFDLDAGVLTMRPSVLYLFPAPTSICMESPRRPPPNRAGARAGPAASTSARWRCSASPPCSPSARSSGR